MRASFALLLAVALALGACGKKPSGRQLAARLDCVEVEGVEPLLQRPKGDVILIEGDDSAVRAAQAIGCAAARQGERVMWGVSAEAAPEADFAAPAAPTPALMRAWAAMTDRFRSAGADVELVTLTTPGLTETPAIAPNPAADVSGEARARRLEGALDDVRARLSPERTILFVSSPDGARAPVGLSGETWRPLGARLPPQKSISLRAEASAKPGVRVRLTPFEDLPAVGAALRYDGIVEVGPPLSESQRAEQAPLRLRARTS
ncbi:MAG: hypothetical protein JNJ73_01295 [Hyphomonadaceae bacterium]|nr:hypothetical protein [Hyphomonadaceae bacterium]